MNRNLLDDYFNSRFSTHNSSANNKVVPHLIGPNSSESVRSPFSTEPAKEFVVSGNVLVCFMLLN